LGVHRLPTAGAGQAGKDCRSSTTATVADEQGVLTVQNTRFISRSLMLLPIVTALSKTEHVQLCPLIQDSPPGICFAPPGPLPRCCDHDEKEGDTRKKDECFHPWAAQK
jgi:hypothetical protein